jgi:prepilin-type N-terminal cleavage/methylation domain-containing protein
MKYKSSSGFTFIEILIAVAVMLGLVALYGATLHTFSVTSDTSSEDIALRVASQKVDDLRAGGYAALPASGTFADSQLARIPSGAASTTITALNAKTKQVQVTVSWYAGKLGTRSISLSTLITQVGGL